MSQIFVLKICPSEWVNASRDKRELSVCSELGYKTAVLAKGDPKDKGREDNVDGFTVYRCSTRPLGARIPAPINRLASLFTWAKYVRKLEPDIITGHDIKGLFIGWLSNRFTLHRSKLVYDSHEFEIGRNANRGKVQVWGVTRLERFLIKRCAFSIMVNDSIADEVQKIHRLKERPIVVRSTPEKWSINPEEVAERRAEYKKELGSPKWILMYHGLVGKGRGVEGLIDVVAGIPGIGAVVMGNALTPGYMEEIKAYAAEKGVAPRIYFHPAVPFSTLKAYVSAADIGMIISEVPSKSYYYGLPNKFFENIQAETPVIVTELPEMKRIVEQYGIGLTCPVGDLEAAKKCVVHLMENKKLYELMKEHLRAAKQDLCWEKEKDVLKKAYSKVAEDLL